MTISEQNKQEAEKVLMKIENTSINFPYIDSEDGQCIGAGYMTYESAVKLSIQDRQSVLEALDKFIGDELVTEMQVNLTEQINYLKSKL